MPIPIWNPSTSRTMVRGEPYDGHRYWIPSSFSRNSQMLIAMKKRAGKRSLEFVSPMSSGCCKKVKRKKGNESSVIATEMISASPSFRDTCEMNEGSPISVVMDDIQLSQVHVVSPTTGTTSTTTNSRNQIKAFAHIRNQYLLTRDFDRAHQQLECLEKELSYSSIHTAFQVYQFHARLLLENGDLQSFQQCLSAILALVQGNFGQLNKEALDEFASYALLYALVSQSSIDVHQALLQSVNEQQQQFSSAYQHALAVVRAVNSQDFKTFFRLYQNAPHMSAYLMDFLLKRVRQDAYLSVIHAYRPNVGVEQLREWLCFDNLQQTRDFLKEQGAVFLGEGNNMPPFWVDCKASSTGNDGSL